ncbi:MAG: hypothetical protein ACX94B_06410 [Henriciella sp.]
MKPIVFAGLLVCAACTTSSTFELSSEGQFFERLKTLCDGQAYAGTLVSHDDADADFKGADMRMGPARCEGETIFIPFAVEDDRSRTWQVTRTDSGVRLKHDHVHKDGSEDVLTQYGGDSNQSGSAAVQFFPADDETKTLFIQEGIEVSTQNTWSVEIDPGTRYVYQMSRPERLFRVEFDLTTPVEAPPPTWREVPVE